VLTKLVRKATTATENFPIDLSISFGENKVDKTTSYYFQFVSF